MAPVKRLPIVIVGGGGHGREVHDNIDALNADSPHFEVIGYVDDNPSDVARAAIEARGSSILGGTEWFTTQRTPRWYVVGVADGEARSRLDRMASDAGFTAAVVVHPTASVGSLNHIGAGSVLWPGARVTTNVRLGRHVHLNQNSCVGHDSVLADFVTVNPLAAISGGCTVGSKALIGSHAVVLQGLHLGEACIVGAAACVVRDVDPASVVKGVPAK